MSQVSFRSGDTDLDGYLAVPAGAGPWPGVVVVHDVFGFRGDVRDRADRIAAQGTPPSPRRCTGAAASPAA